MRSVPVILFTLLSACSKPSASSGGLMDALSNAQLTLGEAVAVAESTGGTAVRASLVVDAEPVFSVDTRMDGTFSSLRIDAGSGEVLSNDPVTLSVEPCDAVSLADAIAVAEIEVGGDAVSAEPDDDGNCNTEVIVLVDASLWEVKVGPSGTVVEDPELADGEGEKYSLSGNAAAPEGPP